MYEEMSLVDELEMAASRFEKDAKRFSKLIGRQGSGQGAADSYDAMWKVNAKAKRLRERTAFIKELKPEPGKGGFEWHLMYNLITMPLLEDLDESCTDTE